MMDSKLCLSVIVIYLIGMEIMECNGGQAMGQLMTSNATLVLQYSSKESIRFGLSFIKIPSPVSEHNIKIYLVMVTGVWGNDLSFEEIISGKMYYRKMKTRSVMLYAILTSQYKLCDSQKIFETGNLQPSDSRSLEVNFKNNCHGIREKKQAVVITKSQKGQFSCKAPAKVILPPYLYYTWSHNYVNASLNIGPYHWHSSDRDSTFSLIAENFDNNTTLQCKIALSVTGHHEIVLNEYNLFTRYERRYGSRNKMVGKNHKNPKLLLRYGNNQHVKFDCIDAMPSDSFGWHLIEVNTKNSVRVSDNIINNRTFDTADTNTELVCLFYVRDERVITKRAVLIYDASIKNWMGQNVTMDKNFYYIVGTVSFVIVVILVAVSTVLWMYKTNKRHLSVDQTEITETHALMTLQRRGMSTGTPKIPINSPLNPNLPIIKQVKPHPPVNMVRPIQYTDPEFSNEACGSNINYQKNFRAMEANAPNVQDDDMPIYENLRMDINYEL